MSASMSLSCRISPPLSSPLLTMTHAMDSLLNVFAGHAAFIFIDRLSRDSPQFHVVPSSHIRQSGSHSAFHEPAISILVVTRDIFCQPASLARVIHSIAYDTAVHTVCAEGVALAEFLATDASLYHSWAPYI
ncbi:hypothetical protein EV424DRAFT_1534279 [Suillus variegatus]|nr:hypothetical protein EV424DRAFT_1534279 [Suillus variegatus]